MTEIINFIARELEQALAQGLTRDQARQAAEIATRTQFAGERPYIAGLPKTRAVQIARNNMISNREAATRTGLSIRRIQQLRRT
ncbi:MAG: hypothetical protein NTX56_18340 [Proteobacteria bacterium]|nr:hypothetical protein [Pseudomonadota bacterium]